MKLITERLLIRPWTLNDVPHYKSLSTDVGYNCFSPPGIFLVKDEQETISKIQNRMHLFEEHGIGKFLLFEKDTNYFIGTCGADFFDFLGEKEVELGYRLLLTHWGKGFATEAAHALVNYLLKDLRLQKIYGFALHQNKQSLKILEKVGFCYEREFMWFDLPHKLYAHR